MPYSFQTVHQKFIIEYNMASNKAHKNDYIQPYDIQKTHQKVIINYYLASNKAHQKVII